MYSEIHPLFYDSATAFNSGIIENQKTPDSAFYKQMPPCIIRLDTIRKISEEKTYDESLKYFRIKISDDYHEDILVPADEGEKLKKKLIATENQDGLTEAIGALNTTLRSLYDLLRARLH